MKSLMAFYVKHRHRFTDIIDGSADKEDVMQRPHFRFNGDTLDEINQKWAHAENDARGWPIIQEGAVGIGVDVDYGDATRPDPTDAGRAAT